ncbi:uncharacterized protein LOC134811828 [Bolinopsis microptera]|uniref:uncharacterized protein LOC134811828 n=1 Tax=Bolinopsis microptera TaxID=2820187 RepID=UPI003079CCA6
METCDFPDFPVYSTEGLYCPIPEYTSNWLEVGLISLCLLVWVSFCCLWYYEGPVPRSAFIVRSLVPISVIYELTLLWSQSTGNEALYHYQYVVYIVIPLSLVMLRFNTDKETNSLLLPLIIGLFAEAIFYTPFGAFRQRGGQYGKMWRSGSTFYSCWLPLCYAILYGNLTCVVIVFLPIKFTQEILEGLNLNYLTTSISPAFSLLHNILRGFTNFFAILGLTYITLLCHIGSVIYFSYQGNSGGRLPENTSHYIEVSVIFLNLVIWGMWLVYNCEVKLKRAGTLLLTDATANYTSTEQVTVENIEQVFRFNTPYNYELAAIKHISVFSSPLTAPFKSSAPYVRSFMQRQYLPVDYHAFVVFETDGMFWAVDKMKDGIFVSWSKNLESAVFYFQDHLRPKPIHLLVQDASTSSLIDMVRRLKSKLDSNKYDLVDRNCQHFSKEVFDKFAIDKTWDFTSPTDLTSPLKLFSDGGYPLFLFVWTVSVLCELFFLYSDEKEEDNMQRCGNQLPPLTHSGYRFVI